MIDGDILCFPNNIVDLLATKLAEIDSPDTAVVKRPLDLLDQDQTISVVPVDWIPVPNSAEMGRGINPHEEPIQVYTIMVQALINDTDEERAIRRHSLLSTLVRRMIYRDQVLHLALAQLQVTVDDVLERTLKWDVRSQRWLVNRRDSSFLYRSALEFQVETENMSLI